MLRILKRNRHCTVSHVSLKCLTPLEALPLQAVESAEYVAGALHETKEPSQTVCCF